MDVHYSKNLSHAFVVSPDGVKKIVELLQKHIGKVDISAGCADDFSREFKTVKDLIAYENSKTKEISSIYLRARSDDYSKSITIVFRRSSWLSLGISIDAIGREDVVSRLKEKILDIVAGMRPWYDVVYRLNLLCKFLLWGIFFILGFIRILSYISVLALESKWVPVDEILTILAALPRGRLAITSILLLVIALSFNKLREFFFPSAVFMIGQGESRFKYKERFQWVVIIGFVVSLAASFVVPIITIIF